MGKSKISVMLESCGKIKDLLYSADLANIKLGIALALSTENLDFEEELLQYN